MLTFLDYSRFESNMECVDYESLGLEYYSQTEKKEFQVELQKYTNPTFYRPFS